MRFRRKSGDSRYDEGKKTSTVPFVPARLLGSRLLSQVEIVKRVHFDAAIAAGIENFSRGRSRLAAAAGPLSLPRCVASAVAFHHEKILGLDVGQAMGLRGELSVVRRTLDQCVADCQQFELRGSASSHVRDRQSVAA